METYWICDMFGNKLKEVFPTSGQARTVINGVGEGRHDFLLRSPSNTLTPDDARDLFRPWARFLVACWNDVPRYAGYIQRVTWDRDTGVISIDSREYRAILSKRYPWMIPTYPLSTIAPAGWEWKVTGKSLRGVARAIVQKCGHFPSDPTDPWQTPVVLIADEAGPFTFSWWAFNLQSGEDMLTQIQDADTGPDIYFRPRWSAANKLELAMEAAYPRLTAGTLERVAPAPMNGTLGSVAVFDGPDQLTGLFGLGEGSEQDMKVGLAGPMAGSLVPTMDTKRSYKAVTEQASLNAISWGALAADREPIRQDGKQALAADFFAATGVGGTLREWMDGDEFLVDGWTEHYIIGMTMRVGADVVDLEVQ